jgi:hypothetical protein
MAVRRVCAIYWQWPNPSVSVGAELTTIEGFVIPASYNFTDADLCAQAEAAGRNTWDESDILTLLDARYPLPSVDSTLLNGQDPEPQPEPPEPEVTSNIPGEPSAEPETPPEEPVVES